MKEKKKSEVVQQKSNSAAICIDFGNELKAIKVEAEGNPAFTGATLYAKYQQAAKVLKLMDQGDLYLLKEKIAPEAHCCHYILKNGALIKEVRIQDCTTVCKYRDVRQVDSKGVIKQERKIKARTYRLPIEVYWGEKVEFIYIFDAKTETWSTYGIPFKSERFSELKIGYMNLVNNLVYREDIQDLTPMEKEKLKYTN